MSDAPADVWGELPISDGILRVRLVPGAARNVIRAVQYSGPFTCRPESAMRRLEEALAGVTIDEVPGRIDVIFDNVTSIRKSLKQAAEGPNTVLGASEVKEVNDPVLSGARVLVTLLYALARQKMRRGLVALCLGGGNAVAMIVERVD